MNLTRTASSIDTSLRSFASDNHAGVHPRIFDALLQANDGFAKAYGDDPWTRRARSLFHREFGDDATVLFTTTGSAANVLCLSATLSSFESAICAHASHLNIDECGAPEAWTRSKLLTVPTPDGKLTPERIEQTLDFSTEVHRTQPKLISISQTTEYGTVYSRDEIRAIARYAHDRGLFLHVDGARLANAAVALECSFREMTRECGVDLVSFGGTKNGLMGAEAVIAFRPEWKRKLEFLQKQTLQLTSKMRFVAAQFIPYLEEELWARNASHANQTARALAKAIAHHPRIRLTQKPQANALFARLPTNSIAELQKEFYFYVWDAKPHPDGSEARWMTSFQTPIDWIEAFAKRLQSLE